MPPRTYKNGMKNRRFPALLIKYPVASQHSPVASQHSSRQPTLSSRQPALPVASPPSRQPTLVVSGHLQLSTLAHPLPPPLVGPGFDGPGAPGLTPPLPLPRGRGVKMCCLHTRRRHVHIVLCRLRLPSTTHLRQCRNQRKEPESGGANSNS
jgi:hypothetical protein